MSKKINRFDTIEILIYSSLEIDKMLITDFYNEIAGSPHRFFQLILNSIN